MTTDTAGTGWWRCAVCGESVPEGRLDRKRRQLCFDESGFTHFMEPSPRPLPAEPSRERPEQDGSEGLSE